MCPAPEQAQRPTVAAGAQPTIASQAAESRRFIASMKRRGGDDGGLVTGMDRPTLERWVTGYTAALREGHTFAGGSQK